MYPQEVDCSHSEAELNWSSSQRGGRRGYCRRINSPGGSPTMWRTMKNDEQVVIGDLISKLCSLFSSPISEIECSFQLSSLASCRFRCTDLQRSPQFLVSVFFLSMAMMILSISESVTSMILTRNMHHQLSLCILSSFYSAVHGANADSSSSG